MKRFAAKLSFLLLLVSSSCVPAQTSAPGQSYLGFDRNDYPGDATLPALHRVFRYTGYWLNKPPGENHNTWIGKRALLKRQGFGFLVLYNGHLFAELKGKDAAALGTAEGKDAVAVAIREGFQGNVRIFLDLEEGGRLLSEQAAYVFAWIDAVRRLGARAGVYCSGIEVPDGTGTISTARDILAREMERVASSGGRKGSPALALWVANDECPPSPGCTQTHLPPADGVAGSSSAALKTATTVWQYAQSPRRAEFTGNCPKNYAPDNNCYAPGVTHSAGGFLDLNTASSPDPSEAP